MNETTPLLARPEESKPPSDDYEHLTNVLTILSRPQFSKCWRTLSSRRRAHLAQAKQYEEEANRRAALREAEAAGAPPYIPRYFGDGGALPSEQACESAREQIGFAEEFGRQLDEGYNIFAEAERLLGKLSPELLNQWPQEGGEELMKLRPEIAAQRMRSILLNFLSSRQNGNQHGDSPDDELLQPASPEPVPPQPSLPQPVVQLRGMTLKPVVCGTEVDELSKQYYLNVQTLLKNILRPNSYISGH